jgi:hypothetical protein
MESRAGDESAAAAGENLITHASETIMYDQCSTCYRQTLKHLAASLRKHTDE